MKPRSLLRSRRIASPFGTQLLRAASPRRARSCALLLFVALGSVWIAGCQSYNANLGVPSAQSSFLSYLAPAAKVVGSPAFTLTVNGAGFVTGSVVQWNGTNRNTNVVSNGQLTADIPAGDVANPGTFQIRVMTPGPNDGNNFSNILTFQVCSGACPQDSAATTSRVVSAVPATDAYSPAISADRRYVAFASVSADPSTNASPGLRKIFLRDTCEGAPSGCEPKTILVSPSLQGGDPNGDSRSPAISADGRFVAFASDASDLIENDANGVSDIFLRDTCTGVPEGCTPSTTRVSLGPGGIEANGASDSPSLSPDARFVAFDSEARNLVADGSAAPSGAFLRDTCRGAAGECTPGTTRLAISSAPLR